MRRGFFILLVLSLSACQKLPSDQANYVKAQKAYEESDYSTALSYLKPLVNQGHPAAQLLLAQMYANGRGVDADENKAELLQGLAAVRLAARAMTDSEREAVMPLAKVLASTPQDPEATPAEKEAAKALGKLDPAALEKLGNQLQDMLALTPTELTKPEEAPLNTPALTPMNPAATAPSDTVIPRNTRRTDGITLSLLHQNAEEGDALAMELLSAAYARGFYGLHRNPIQAVRWAKRAARARSMQPDERTDETPSDKWPWDRLIGIIGLGVILVGLGIWQAKRVRSGP